MSEFLIYALVPIAIGAVAVVLLLGLHNVARGGSPHRSQELMRLRLRLHVGEEPALDGMLARIQNDLFDVEADLCLSEKGPGGARMTVTDAQVDWLEQRIDELNADLAPLRSFIQPGGSPAAAYLHLARPVCRRAERIMVE